MNNQFGFNQPSPSAKAASSDSEATQLGLFPITSQLTHHAEADPGARIAALEAELESYKAEIQKRSIKSNSETRTKAFFYVLNNIVKYYSKGETYLSRFFTLLGLGGIAVGGLLGVSQVPMVKSQFSTITAPILNIRPAPAPSQQPSVSPGPPSKALDSHQPPSPVINQPQPSEPKANPNPIVPPATPSAPAVQVSPATAPVASEEVAPPEPVEAIQEKADEIEPPIEVFSDIPEEVEQVVEVLEQLPATPLPVSIPEFPVGDIFSGGDFDDGDYDDD